MKSKYRENSIKSVTFNRLMRDSNLIDALIWTLNRIGNQKRDLEKVNIKKMLDHVTAKHVLTFCTNIMKRHKTIHLWLVSLRLN